MKKDFIYYYHLNHLLLFYSLLFYLIIYYIGEYMKSLIKNYVNKLTIDNLKEFALKNNINLDNTELEYILNLVQKNIDDILINEDKYLSLVQKNINSESFIKIKDLFLYYKNKYKIFLF